ncbi:MAG: hypothetical protein DMG15_16470 [Acidobacteria bacterium]|nr:MAG: hypothetical protein DMG15_16470 [Acidobacteriota bacterium]
MKGFYSSSGPATAMLPAGRRGRGRSRAAFHAKGCSPQKSHPGQHLLFRERLQEYCGSNFDQRNALAR